ncbi:MAG: sigma-70 family RNA polymerase sigma factor [Planctomycetaceae bacterium]
MNDAQADSAETRELLNQAQGGHAESLQNLFGRHRRFLRQVVESRISPRLRRRVDPSDVIQETHLEACRQLGDFADKRPLPFRLWLRKLACQRLTMLERRHVVAAKRSVRREVPLSNPSSLRLARSLLKASTGPSTIYSQRETLRHVRDGLEELSADDREILLLRNLEQLSNEESARVLEIEPAAASQRYGRALLRLRKCLARRGLLGGMSHG